MTREEHKQKHIELHKGLDELFADYINHHPDESSFLKMPLEKLITWAYEQTINTTEIQRALKEDDDLFIYLSNDITLAQVREAQERFYENTFLNKFGILKERFDYVICRKH